MTIVSNARTGIYVRDDTCEFHFTREYLLWERIYDAQPRCLFATSVAANSMAIRLGREILFPIFFANYDYEIIVEYRRESILKKRERVPVFSKWICSSNFAQSKISYFFVM